MLSYGTQKIEIINFTTEYSIDRELLQGLVEKNMLDIYEEEGEFFIDIVKIFESVSNTTPTSDILTIDAMDRISFLLNRQLKPFELESIRKWLDEGYLVENVEIAIQKSVINGVDNFNYVEKVLKNEKSNDVPSNVKIERNVDIY